MRHDQHAPLAIMQRDGIQQRAQPQDDVTPALAARRSVVEFAQQLAKLGLLRFDVADATGGEPIEDAKLLFPKALVAADALAGLAAAMFPEDLRSLTRAHVGRRE